MTPTTRRAIPIAGVIAALLLADTAQPELFPVLLGLACLIAVALGAWAAKPEQTTDRTA